MQPIESIYRYFHNISVHFS